MDDTPQPPGCLLALVSLAGPMGADVATPLGEVPASFASRYVLDFLIDGLAAAGDYAANLEVGVYGYRASPDGLAFEWLLPTPEPSGALAPFAELAAAEVTARADGQPRRWVRGAEADGDPAPALALARAHRVLAWWASRNPDARPPVFVHCATADGADDRAAAIARSIRAVAVRSGPVRVLEWTFTPGTDAGFPSDDVWHLLFDPTEARFDPEPAAAPAFAVERAFWSQKRGNDPHLWEDAYAVSACGTVAAVCDGASDGIFCRDWAARMAERFVTDRPDLGTREGVRDWVNAARNDWRAAINYPTLRWTQQNKVNETGASATLIGLEFGGPAADGERAWRATSVGDACVVHVRGADWLAFPLTASDQFTSAPSLLRTKPGTVAPPAAFATGTCREGDLFLLATDAVAGKILADAEMGTPDWEALAAQSPDDWLAAFDAHRDSGAMVNDDCTLLVLRVAPPQPADPPAEAAPEAEQPALLANPLGEQSDVGQP